MTTRTRILARIISSLAGLGASLTPFSSVAAEPPPAMQDAAPKDRAAVERPIEDTAEIGVLAGLLQPIFARGGNVQLEAAYGRLVFDYSHGFSLNIPAAGAAKDQGLTYHLPYSTGLGVGYRFTEDFDVRFEPKLHKFEVEYDGGPRDGEQIASYHTVTLGLGAYYKWRPFRSTSGAAKGITVAPSFRAWPNVWSSLDDNRITYQSAVTQREETHEAANIGLGNTPFIVNVSVGYIFSI